MSDNNSNNTNLNDSNSSSLPESTEEKGTAKGKERKRRLDIIEYIELIVVTFSIIVVLFSLAFKHCTVDGPSMNNTLEDGDIVVCTNIFYKPKRGDIVVFHQTGTENKPIVKRVIGVPGDKISIEYYSQTMVITIEDKDGNIQILEEDYIKYDYQRYFSSFSCEEVKEGTVFVLGDNRNNSLDSRFESIGLVDTRRILGKVSFRVVPFNKFGSIK